MPYSLKEVLFEETLALGYISISLSFKTHRKITNILLFIDEYIYLLIKQLFFRNAKKKHYIYFFILHDFTGFHFKMTPWESKQCINKNITSFNVLTNLDTPSEWLTESSS